MIRNRIASLALVAAMAFALTAGFTGRASAQQTFVGGPAGLVAGLVAINDTSVVEVNVVDSFNNLRVLNNILNNNDIDVTVGDVTILENFLNNNNVTLENFLNNNNIVLEDIVQIVVLETGDIVVFV